MLAPIQVRAVEAINDPVELERASTLSAITFSWLVRSITPPNIIATMNETDVFPNEAADVAMQAIKEGLARVEMTREEAFAKTDADIKHARATVKTLLDEGLIKEPPQEMLQVALEWALKQVS